MNELVEAIYEQGVFRPLGSVPLTEGATVRLTFESLTPNAADPAYKLVSMAEETGISDLALNIDHYLYGLPKRDNE